MKLAATTTALVLAFLLAFTLTLTGSGVAPGAYNTIQNNKVSLTQRPILNFPNGGCADDPGNNSTDCTPSGGTGNYSQSFTSQTSVTLTHNLGTTAIIVSCYNASSPPQYIGFNTLQITDANDATVTFTSSQSGKCVVAGSAGNSAALFYQTIETAGSAATQRPTLNFTANMTCVDNSGQNRTDCTPSGGGGGSASLNQFGFFGTVTDPTTLSYSYQNQASSVATVGTKALALFTPQSGTLSITGYTTSLTGSSPYTTTMTLLFTTTPTGSNTYAGLCISDGTKLIELGIKAADPSLQILYWTNTSTFSSQASVSSLQLYSSSVMTNLLTLQIQEDSTNRYYRFSSDGVNFILANTEVKSTFLTSPTKTGPCSDTDGSPTWLTIDNLTISNP